MYENEERITETEVVDGLRGGQIPDRRRIRGDRRQRAPVWANEKPPGWTAFKSAVGYYFFSMSMAYCGVFSLTRKRITKLPPATSYLASKGSYHSVVSPGQCS